MSCSTRVSDATKTTLIRGRRSSSFKVGVTPWLSASMPAWHKMNAWRWCFPAQGSVTCLSNALTGLSMPKPPRCYGSSPTSPRASRARHRPLPCRRRSILGRPRCRRARRSAGISRPPRCPWSAARPPSASTAVATATSAGASPLPSRPATASVLGCALLARWGWALSKAPAATPTTSSPGRHRPTATAMAATTRCRA